jgi:hypothetical protein
MAVPDGAYTFTTCIPKHSVAIARPDGIFYIGDGETLFHNYRCSTMRWPNVVMDFVAAYVSSLSVGHLLR